MAGKEYKVQKKAKEQQRLSVFQPAFRWGGNNASSSSTTSSSSKIEAKKNDRPVPNRNDRLERRQNERVDQPRRNHDRLAVAEDPEAKMARDAKRMTTFQPIFGSLFSSKPSKGKSPEPSLHNQAQRPLPNGPVSQQSSRNQAAGPARPNGANAAPGSSRNGRSGPGYQGAGLQINTQDTLSSNPRKNEAFGNSSGRNGRGGLAPAPEDYSPRPRSPLQRNPAIPMPDDDLKPLGISNAFGSGARGKGKATEVSSMAANSTDYVSSGHSRGPRSDGKDRGLGIAMPSVPTTTRNVSQMENQKRSGTEPDIDPATKRERMGIGFRRDDRGAADQIRLNENLIRKPVVSKAELQTDPRAQQQSGRRIPDDGKLAQAPSGPSQNIPQLIITDTSDISSSKGSGPPDRPSKGQQRTGATSSKSLPGQGPASVREASSSVRADDQPPSATNGGARPSARSPLDRLAQSMSSKATEDTQLVSSGKLQHSAPRETLSRQDTSQPGASRPGLNLFPKTSNQSRQPIPESELEAVTSKGRDPLDTTMGRKTVKNLSQVSSFACKGSKNVADQMKPKERQVLESPGTRDVDPLSRNLHSDASANRGVSSKPPFEAFNSSPARQTPQTESLKTSEKSTRDPADSAKAHALGGKQEITFEPLGTRKPGVREETRTSSNPLKDEVLGRAVASRSEDQAGPLKASQSSGAGPSTPKPEKRIAEQPTTTIAIKPEPSRSGWASRYFETPRNDKSDNDLADVERHLVSGKGPKSIATSRGISHDQDRQIYGDTQQSEALGNGATSFKKRIQDGLGAGSENSLLKPLKSRFNAPKKQKGVETLPEESARTPAGHEQAPQVDATSKPIQLNESSASPEPPRKEYKPYAAGKKTLPLETKEAFDKSKASVVPEWLTATKSDMPSRPERPQDELFMGPSGSALRPSASIDRSAPLKPTLSPDPSTKRNPPQDTDVPLLKVRTDRSETLSTHQPAEAARSSKPEQDSREYTLVTAGTPVNLRGETSRSTKLPSSSVRVVSGIIERPKEIDIQKSSRAAKITRPSDSEVETNRNPTGVLENIPSRQQETVDAKQLDYFSSQVEGPIQVTDLSRRPDDNRRNQNRDQIRHTAKNEATKQTLVNEWPRPSLAPAAALQDDIVDRSRVVDGDREVASPALLEPEVSQPRGILGRWAGRGKTDKMPERPTQSLATKQSLVTKEPETSKSFETAFDGQKPPHRQDTEDAVSPGQSGQPARNTMDAPSIQVIDPAAQDIIEGTNAPRHASAAKIRFSSSKDIKSPAQIGDQCRSERYLTDAPAPLKVSGRRPAQLVETESKSCEESGFRSPPKAEKQSSANGKLTDHDTPDTTRAGDSNITSPELPSQEDFFKQMRQSVMFQKADSSEKIGLPESTDTTWNRKSKRNRNVSISGWQPSRGAVPDMPTFDTSDYQSVDGAGDSASYPGVPETVPDLWPRQASLASSQRRDVYSEKAPNDNSTILTEKNEPKTRDIMAMPSTLAGQSHAYATEQAKLQSSDTGYKSPILSATDTSVRDFEKSLVLDPSLSAAPRGLMMDTPTRDGKMARVAESNRVPLHPAPSSAGVFRQPSFGDQEGFQQPMTTHDLTPSVDKADPKPRDLFEGMFKSKKSEDLTSGLGSSGSHHEGIARGGQSVDLANDGPVKGLSASPQADGGGKDSPSLSGVASPASLGLHGLPEEQSPEQSEVGARSLFDRLRSPTRTANETPGGRLAPVTPDQHFMGDVASPRVPLELTSDSPQMTGHSVTEKTTEDPSPYSIDVPMLFVEDRAGSPKRREDATVGHLMSTEPSREVDQHLGSLEAGDLSNSPQMARGAQYPFASKYDEEAKLLPHASPALIQDNEPIEAVGSPHAAHKSQNASSSTPSNDMFAKSHIRTGGTDSAYMSPNKDWAGKVGDEQKIVFSDQSPTSPVPEAGQQWEPQPSELGGHLKQGAISRSLDLPLDSGRETTSLEGRASPWMQVADQQDVLAKSDTSHHTPDHLQLSGERGRKPSSVYPLANDGLNISSRDSDRDLSDQILSLYDGSDYGTPDDQSTAGLFKRTSSSRELHSSLADDAASVASIEPIPAGSFKSKFLPTETNNVVTPEPSTNDRPTLGSFVGSTPPLTTPTHELSEPVNAETGNAEPSPSRNGGLKDRLRTLFSKADNVEPGYDPHAQSTMVSSVPEPIYSPALSENATYPQDGNAMSPGFTPSIFGSRIDDMDLQQIRTPLEGPNFASTRSDIDIESDTSSSQAVEKDHLTEQAMTPKPSREFAMPVPIGEEERSPSQAILNSESTPSRAPMGQDGDLSSSMTLDSPRAQGFSPELNSRPIAFSPLPTDDDEDHFRLRESDGMPRMDEFGTQSQHELAGDISSRHGSYAPEAISDATFSRTTTDPYETRQLSEDPEAFNHIATSPVNDVDAFSPVTPLMEPTGETGINREHLQMSPKDTADHGEFHPLGGSLLRGDDETRVSQSPVSEPGLESPGFGQDAFQNGASPMPQGGKDWAVGGVEQIQDSHHASPQPNFMHEELLEASEPGNPMVTNEALALRGYEDKAWNDEAVPSGSYTPDSNDMHHGADGVPMLGGAEHAFDAEAEHPYDLDGPGAGFAAEHSLTHNDDPHVDDVQDGPQGFVHTDTNGSTFGNDHYGDGAFDDFDNANAPISDSYNGTNAESYPIGEHQSHMGEFDDIPGGAYHEDDNQGSTTTFDGPELGSPVVDEVPHIDSDLEGHQIHAFDAHQDNAGGIGDVATDHYPADNTPSPGAGFEEAMLDNYQDNDVQSHPAAFDDAEMDHYPVDGFANDTIGPKSPALDHYGAGDIDETNMYQSDPMVEGPPPPYEPDHDLGHLADDAEDFNPHNEEMLHEGPAFSDHGGENEIGLETDQMVPDNGIHDDYSQDGYRDNHLGADEISGGEPEHDHQGAGMGFVNNREGDSDGLGDEEGWNSQGQDAELDHDSGGHLDYFDGEPSREAEANYPDFGEGGAVDHGEPLAAEWDGDHLDEGRGLEGADEYPMNEGDDFPVGGEAEEYLLGGGEVHPPDTMVGESPPMGGEAEEYLMGGEGNYPMDGMEEGDDLRMEEDEALPIGDMYGEDERVMEPVEGEDYPLGDGEPLPVMDGDEYPMDGLDQFPMDGKDESPMEGEEFEASDRDMDDFDADDQFPTDGPIEFPLEGEEIEGSDRGLDEFDDGQFPMDGQDGLPMEEEEFEGSDRGLDDFVDGQFPMDGQNELPMADEEFEGSDRGIDDLDADDQIGDDMSTHDSVLDEEHGTEFDEGSVEARSLVDEELGSNFGEEDLGSEVSDPFDEEPIGDYDPEDGEHAPSEVEDREMEESTVSSVGEEVEENAQGQDTMDDLYEADVPSIPASPTSTDNGRGLASPTSVPDHDEDSQDEDSIFGELAAQQDPADPENTDPVRLSCLYMQDVGLMSIPSTPTVPQEDDTPEPGEEEQEEPREPVRFSALYRQSLDWSQALDSSMWEDFGDTLPEENEEQVLTAPVLQPVPESARRESHEGLQTLEVDQEPLTPVAASPLSPRPLETPPPDLDLGNSHHGYMEVQQFGDQPAELNKAVNDDANQRFPTSPRLQPTPPPDQDRASSSVDVDGQRDSRGPRTFDEMNLPRRVISPPNAGEDSNDLAQDGSSSTYVPTYNGRRSISQRFSGWWAGAGGSSGQVSARPPPLPAPYDSRYGEPSSPV